MSQQTEFSEELKRRNFLLMFTFFLLFRAFFSFLLLFLPLCLLLLQNNFLENQLESVVCLFLHCFLLFVTFGRGKSKTYKLQPGQKHVMQTTGTLCRFSHNTLYGSHTTREILYIPVSLPTFFAKDSIFFTLFVLVSGQQDAVTFVLVLFRTSVLPNIIAISHSQCGLHLTRLERPARVNLF